VELKTSVTEKDDLPEDDELPLSSFAFCTLYTALRDSRIKPRMEKYTGVTTATLLSELTSLVPKIYAVEKISIVQPSLLESKHPKYASILESIAKEAALIIVEASYEFYRLDELCVANVKAETQNAARSMGAKKQEATAATTIALDNEKLRNTSTLQQTLGQHIQTAAKTEIAELSRRQNANCRRNANKKRKHVQQTQATESVKDSGGSKSPRSDPSAGKQQQNKRLKKSPQQQTDKAKSSKKKCKQDKKANDTSKMKEREKEKEIPPDPTKEEREIRTSLESIT
jgi:hypothetical protein